MNRTDIDRVARFPSKASATALLERAYALFSSSSFATQTLIAVLSIAVGFMVMELPWNERLLAMEPAYASANLGILALLFSIVFLLGQRTRTAAAVFTGLCLLVGVANHFIVEFKGQPIVPADLFALGTAASVSGGYTLLPDARVILCTLLYGSYVALLHALPLAPAHGSGPIQRAAAVSMNLLCAAVFALVGLNCLSTTDIGEEYDCTVDVWDVRGSYASQGTALCFLTRFQQLAPSEPYAYSAALADELLAANRARTAPHAPKEEETMQASFGESAEEEPSLRPHIIAVMNETFSDLSIFPGLEQSNAEPRYANDLAERSAYGGTAFVSALGGGTCNSEFEFLTGASLGNLGGGEYPYMLYDFDGASNLAAHLASLGYTASAIHPAEASNWRREAVYGQLGFERFDDIDWFKAQPDYEEALFRRLVSDRRTYERALELIDEAEGPQFVFDVTIQNHGGYETQLIDEADRVELGSDAIPPEERGEIEEFISCIRASEADLAWLIDELEQREAPIVLCFFGDHQPGFTDQLFERTYGTSIDGVPLAQVQQRFSTPYFIWGNSSARALGLARPTSDSVQPASLNYLGAMLLDAAGLPHSDHTAFLATLRDAVPAINMNGYLTADGEWHWFDQDAGVNDELWQYSVVQFRDLFGR